MIWWVVLLKFLFGCVAMFFTCAFILSCIGSALNPQLNVDNDGNVEELGDKSRMLFSIILSIAWAVVIAL